ncbi:F-box protein SKIP24 isoform X1 [Carex littledalei]|uniref:F-box protein SKIP24 isoform X1 n=1 Tax=Carex littledalei TaxID=544730 RepID=A0A833RN41_9POAL|nr:F-box protein SKIP24 isoform X1 [Carex littledalei]
MESESVPGHVWHQILQIGIQMKRLNHTDICSLAIVNSYFYQLTQDSALWATLLSRDFRSAFEFAQAPPKARYKWKHDCRRALKEQIKTCFPDGFP